MILINKEAIQDINILKQTGHCAYLVPLEIIEQYETMIPPEKRFMSENLAQNGIDSIYVVKGIKPPIFDGKTLKPSCKFVSLVK